MVEIEFSHFGGFIGLHNTQFRAKQSKVSASNDKIRRSKFLLIQVPYNFLKNGSTPASFIVYFGSYQTNIITIFTTHM